MRQRVGAALAAMRSARARRRSAGRRTDRRDRREAANAGQSAEHQRRDRRGHHPRDGERGERRGHAEVPARARPAQTPYRRQFRAAGDAHLGPRLERAQPDLRRRNPALGPDRQQQRQRQPQMAARLARGDREDRGALRALFGRLSGELDRRGGEHHHAHAEHARSARRPRRPRSERGGRPQTRAGAGLVAVQRGCSEPPLRSTMPCRSRWRR